MRLVVVFVLLAVGIFPAAAQSVLNGSVTDASTGEAIPFANVFFANTTIGTTTSENGAYKIQDFPEGKYDLTVSFVGYTTFTQSVDFSSGGSKEINIKLDPHTIQLAELMVEADTVGRHQNYIQFKRLFLGATNNSKGCKIANPNDIYLYYDVQERVLVAHAKKPIEVVNEALGYRLFYILDTFEMNAKEGRLFVFGIPRFEELSPNNRNQENRWNRQRADTYHGSLTDLLLAMVTNTTDARGFTIRKLFRVPNPKRPAQEVLRERIAYWRAKNEEANNGQVIVRESRSDSLSYYLKLNREPAIVDSLGEEIKDFAPWFSENTFTYTGYLHITYRFEREEIAFSEMNGRNYRAQQQSIIQFLDHVTIYENGYYEDIRNVFLEGYLAWSEKIAELLPLGYVPLK